MHQSVESHSVSGRASSGGSVSSASPDQQTKAAETWEARKADPANKAQPKQTPSTIGQSVLDFVQAHPVVAAGAALALGAAVVMVVNARRVDSGRLDRRALRAMRGMERSFSREMRALRHSDVADRLGRVGGSFGDAFSRIDLTPLTDLGKTYLEAARNRLGR